MKLKRVFAYIIDIFLVIVFSTLIFTLPIFKDSLNNYLDISEKTLKQLDNKDLDGDELINLQYTLYKSTSDLLIIRLGVTFLYFGVLAFLLNGRTLGKIFFKLRVVPYKGNKLNPTLFMIRSILLSNILFDLISIIILITCSKSIWLTSNTIISYISYIALFSLFLSILIRPDGRGIHDLICNTKILEER